jgi:hypothetical protein
MSLDIAQGTAVRGPASIAELTGGQDDVSKLVADALPAPGKAQEWSQVLTDINSWFDKQIRAAGAGTYAQRIGLIVKVEKELQDRLAGGLAGASAADLLLSISVAKLSKAAQTDERVAMDFELTQVVLALRAHKARGGAYPDNLDAVAPALGGKVPADRFAGAPLRYARAGDGYMLYSVGPNARDDGGVEPGSGEDLTVKADK